jgi:hypothetical protein
LLKNHNQILYQDLSKITSYNNLWTMEKSYFKNYLKRDMYPTLFFSAQDHK